MEGKTKNYLSMVVLGHVDAGKSTVAGRLLHLTGAVSNSELDKLATQSAELGKPSFKYAWIVNKSNEERERGITIRIYHNRLETSKHIVNMINVPGHR
jgi:elongation factor 1-alpha